MSNKHRVELDEDAYKRVVSLCALLGLTPDSAASLLIKAAKNNGVRKMLTQLASGLGRESGGTSGRASVSLVTGRIGSPGESSQAKPTDTATSAERHASARPSKGRKAQATPSAK